MATDTDMADDRDRVKVASAAAAPTTIRDSMSSYLTGSIKRFGEYATAGLSDSPEAFDPHLELVRAAADVVPPAEAAAAGEAA